MWNFSICFDFPHAHARSHLVLMHVWFDVHSVFFCFFFFGVSLSGGNWLDNWCDCITSKNSTIEAVTTIKSTVNENTQRFFILDQRKIVNRLMKKSICILMFGIHSFIHFIHWKCTYTQTSFMKCEWSRRKSNRIPQHCCIDNDQQKLNRRHCNALLHIQFPL